MKPLRILALVREGLEPPEMMPPLGPTDPSPDWKMEFDVVSTLREMGNDVRVVAVYSDLSPIREAVLEWKPHIAFMMLEEFHGVPVYDQAVTSYMELFRQRYTGCNPTGLLITHDKALSKKILTYHRVPTPRFMHFPRRRRITPSGKARYPLLVKSATEDASHGISQASLVTNDQALRDRVEFVHTTIGSDALAEEFIDGREFYVSVLGNRRLQTFPIWEMDFSNMPEDAVRIATRSVKWDAKYQHKYKIMTHAAAGLTAEQQERILHVSKRAFHLLHMSGYGRIDLRMNSEGQVYVLEANANSNLSYGEDFAESAHAGGVTYEALLKRIINLGRRYRAAWQHEA